MSGPDVRGAALVDVEGVTVRYRHGVGGRRAGVTALDSVSVSVGTSETVGVVGESGSGKSTLGRVCLGLVRPDSGRVLFAGREIGRLDSAGWHRFRRSLQVVHQDPWSSLNPSRTVGEVLGELVGMHQGLRGRARDDRVAELVRQVGLRPEHVSRYPEALSGGQRQRLALARALAPGPRLVVCDEALSALDVSTQSQVLDLLQRLQDQVGVSYLFISHDLDVVRRLARRIVVLYGGQVMEEGGAQDVVGSPLHPYTEALLAASPVADPAGQERRRELRRRVLVGEPERPSQGGCPFARRCRYAMPICREERPGLFQAGRGASVACHLYRASTAGTIRRTLLDHGLEGRSAGYDPGATHDRKGEP